MSLIIETRTKRTMSCDNPKCGLTITWFEEDAQKEEDAVPREFFRFLIVLRAYVDPDKQKTDPGKYTFCSRYCIEKWMQTTYKPSTPPLLSTELEDACKKIEADRDKGTGQDAPCEDAMPSVEVAPLEPEYANEYHKEVVEEMKSNVIPFPVRKTNELDTAPSELEPA